MKLNQIKGNTYWIRGGTNTGVYIFEDNTVLLIDTGIGGSRINKMVEILQENKMDVKYIMTTHEHEDHCGGNYQIREIYPDVIIYAPKRAKIYMENPDVYVDFLIGGRHSQNIKSEIEKHFQGSTKVDNTVYPGEKINIKNHIFEIVDCSGHTSDGVGIKTDDDVVFLADLMVTKNSLAKFDFLFMYDYPSQIRSLENVKNIDFKYSILGHSRGVYSKSETIEIADYNYKALVRLVEFVMDTLKEPKTIDEIIKNFIDIKKLPSYYMAYLEYRNSLNATLAFLHDLKLIEVALEDNILKYVAIEKYDADKIKDAIMKKREK
ncbi:MBL fold metallo-hydrolase [Peptostreptococcus faecalis]|uniref:MBL fold metallo-hydrolase n=1 Tax=Peptostreptococcus faecalis TaxID=2045015 RepID=UPI000C798CE6|nr:MBL fold metallo-hydrolase [Peptostreptococcus faecalis]